jgi:hypothetical protein
MTDPNPTSEATAEAAGGANALNEARRDVPLRAAHERTHFFKYATASTAIAILSTATLRYSSPLLFNDPFDLQTGMPFKFDMDALPERLFAKVEALVLAPNIPEFFDPNGHPWSRVILEMRAKLPNHGFPRESLRQALLPLFAMMKDYFLMEHKRFQQEWLERVPRMRMLCVTEEHDNLLMWAHYSRNHTGAVLELRVMPEEDNALCAAQPVIYHPDVPSPFSEEHLLDAIVGAAKLTMDELCRHYARAKSAIWSYEKEWRLYDLAPTADPPFYEHSGLRRDEVEAIYLGCRMDESDRVSIMEMVRRRHQNTAVFQASKAGDTYALRFRRLS